MLSAHDLYLEAHERLFLCSSEDELLKACSQTVENYLENRAIWQELTHYKNHGVLLAAHPIFSWTLRRDQIRKLTVSELVRLKERHANNLIRGRKKLRDNPGHTLSLKRKENISRLERELVEINSLLNLR